MPERGFLSLWIFLLFFLEFSCLGRVWTEFRTKNFFHSFLANLIPFSLKRMPEVVFQIFEFFCYVFRNFLARVGYERNSGRNFFFLFLGLSHPVWAKNNAGKRFFYFLNYFAIFFWIFFCGSSMNGIRD